MFFFCNLLRIEMYVLPLLFLLFLLFSGWLCLCVRALRPPFDTTFCLNVQAHECWEQPRRERCECMLTGWLELSVLKCVWDGMSLTHTHARSRSFESQARRQQQNTHKIWHKLSNFSTNLRKVNEEHASEAIWARFGVAIKCVLWVAGYLSDGSHRDNVGCIEERQ